VRHPGRHAWVGRYRRHGWEGREEYRQGKGSRQRGRAR
jgi:hypothetical protein